MFLRDTFETFEKLAAAMTDEADATGGHRLTAWRKHATRPGVYRANCRDCGTPVEARKSPEGFRVQGGVMALPFGCR